MGSRAIARSWFPSTANVGSGRRSTSLRSRASPRGWVRRSPVIATRSGERSAVQSTLRRTACRAGEGTPRWKSERCTILKPSSARGSDGRSTSRSASRTHAASSRPQPSPRPTAYPASLESLAPTSDLELLKGRPRVDDVALELQLRLLEPGRDADELRQVQDRHVEPPPGRGLELRLPRVE